MIRARPRWLSRPRPQPAGRDFIVGRAAAGRLVLMNGQLNGILAAPPRCSALRPVPTRIFSFGAAQDPCLRPVRLASIIDPGSRKIKSRPTCRNDRKSGRGTMGAVVKDIEIAMTGPMMRLVADGLEQHFT